MKKKIASIATKHAVRYGKRSTFDSTAQSQLRDILIAEGFQVEGEERSWGHSSEYFAIKKINGVAVEVDQSSVCSVIKIRPGNTYKGRYDDIPDARIICGTNIDVNKLVKRVKEVIAYREQKSKVEDILQQREKQFKEIVDYVANNSNYIVLSDGYDPTRVYKINNLLRFVHKDDPAIYDFSKHALQIRHTKDGFKVVSFRPLVNISEWCNFETFNQLQETYHNAVKMREDIQGLLKALSQKFEYIAE